MKQELLVSEVLPLSDVGFLDEVYQAVCKLRIHAFCIDQKRLDEAAPLSWLKCEPLLLVVIKDYLENAFSFKSFIFVIMFF